MTFSVPEIEVHRASWQWMSFGHVGSSQQLRRRDKFATLRFDVNVATWSASPSSNVMILTWSQNPNVVMRETETRGKYKGKDIHMIVTESAVLEKRGDSWTTHFHWSSRKGK
jgi:hypothetical protein